MHTVTDLGRSGGLGRGGRGRLSRDGGRRSWLDGCGSLRRDGSWRWRTLRRGCLVALPAKQSMTHGFEQRARPADRGLWVLSARPSAYGHGHSGSWQSQNTMSIAGFAEQHSLRRKHPVIKCCLSTNRTTSVSCLCSPTDVQEYVTGVRSGRRTDAHHHQWLMRWQP